MHAVIGMVEILVMGCTYNWAARGGYNEKVLVLGLGVCGPLICSQHPPAAETQFGFLKLLCMQAGR